MPASSRRRGNWVARFNWPPALPEASSTLTVWPRAAATRAASSPAGPAPTTTTRLGAPSVLAMTLRHGGLAAGGGVVDAQRLAALIDAVQAVGRADTGADPVFEPLRHLVGDVRVGHVRASHADHVELSRGHRMARVATSAMRAAWNIGISVASRTSTGEIEMRGERIAGDRDDPGKSRVGVDAAADDVEEVELARSGSRCAIWTPSVRLSPAWLSSSATMADADDETRPDAARPRRSPSR